MWALVLQPSPTCPSVGAGAGASPPLSAASSGSSTSTPLSSLTPALDAVHVCVPAKAVAASSATDRWTPAAEATTVRGAAVCPKEAVGLLLRLRDRAAAVPDVLCRAVSSRRLKHMSTRREATPQKAHIPQPAAMTIAKPHQPTASVAAAICTCAHA